jgi:probable HAF family extracellular repeat protein
MNPAGQWLDIGTLGGYESFARALNDWSHAIGYTRDTQDHHVGYLWTPSGGMIDIGNLGGYYCDPEDIDNFDRIVGVSANASGDHRPFLWEKGVMIDLGTLGGTTGRAKGINDFGVVVGNASDASGSKRAVIWEDGMITDLNTLIPAGTGWELTGSAEINELGEIAGTGYLNGNQRAYKLTPVLSSPRISGFQPGFAGRRNTLFGLGFTPNAVVGIYIGLSPGSTTLPCGATLDIANARLLAITSANFKGRIEFTLTIPAIASGLEPLLQAVEPISLVVGELFSQRIQ